MPKKSSPLPITSAQRQTLETWIRAHNTPQSIAIRAKIILLAADGLSNVKIAQEANVTRPTVIFGVNASWMVGLKLSPQFYLVAVIR